MRRVVALSRSGVAAGHLAVQERGFTRGIPYAPQGSIQDFTSSPRHGQLPDLQRNLDKSAGRAPTGLYDGPTITTKDGPRPLFPRGGAPARHGLSGSGPSPDLPHFPRFSVRPTSPLSMQPPQQDNYQQDLRSDPAQADTPEHIVAARQRIMTMQSDSFGESPRGIVAPPPPLDPDAPREYRQPRVPLDDTWWKLMWGFFILFLVMAKFGK